MTRSPTLRTLLARYGIEPCGDGSCMFGRAEGVTFACSCMSIFRDPEGPPLGIWIKRLAAIIRELDQQPEQIAAWLESPRDKRDLGLQAMDEFHRATIAAAVRAGRWKERG